MILVVDHYDSFVYNLVQLVAAGGHEVQVRSSSADVAELVALTPDAVILSPGPGRPERAGCFVELVRALPTQTPLLGVCLGHQALASAYGGRVGPAPRPVHGKTSPVLHQGEGVLRGLPCPFEGGRYHSLVVDGDTLPTALKVTATTADGLVMALEHRKLPRFGLQFHPESILTREGPRIVDRFLEMAG
ncbi:MAG: anthranilate synthase component II [Candidatus Dormibacteria bacterium]